MKLSAIIELARQLKENKRHDFNKGVMTHSLNEKYEAKEIRNIAKHLDDICVWNTTFNNYGNFYPDPEKQPHLNAMYLNHDVWRRIEMKLGESIGNPRALREETMRLMTDTDYFISVGFDTDPDEFTEKTWELAQQEFKLRNTSIGKVLRSMYDLRAFRLAKVKDSEVDIISIDVARKPKYSKGLQFWFNLDNELLYVSYNNQVIIEITDQMMFEYIIKPDKTIRKLPDDEISAVNDTCQRYEASKYYNGLTSALRNNILQYYYKYGLETRIASRAVRVGKAIKDRWDTTSTKSLITDTYKAREIGKIVCINLENFESHNDHQEFGRRVKYNAWLDEVQAAATKRVQEIERVIRQSRFINEYTGYVDKIEEAAPQLMDALMHMNDLVMLLISEHKPETYGRYLQNVKHYSELIIDKIYYAINVSYELVQAIARLSEFNSVKVIKEQPDAVKNTISEISAYYMDYKGHINGAALALDSLYDNAKERMDIDYSENEHFKYLRTLFPAGRNDSPLLLEKP